jgi:hypothetical protein
VLVASVGAGAVVAAGAGFVAYGALLLIGWPWIAFFLSSAGVAGSTRDRINAAIITPEAWLYYGPAAFVLLYLLGIAVFCLTRSFLVRRRKRAGAPEGRSAAPGVMP